MRRTFRLAILSAALGLSACQQPPAIQDQYYRLNAVPPAKAAQPVKLVGTLEVERFAADGLTASRPLVYSDSGQDHILQVYHYHFWVEPPPVILRDQLADYLRAARVATTVVTPDVRAAADYVVGGRIKRLERVVGAQPAALVELELWLRGVRDNRVRVLQTYRVRHEGGKGSVAEAVLSINRSLNVIFGRFLDDIRKS